MSATAYCLLRQSAGGRRIAVQDVGSAACFVQAQPAPDTPPQPGQASVVAVSQLRQPQAAPQRPQYAVKTA
ncbi:hypothetical protein [Chromobacterium amazonense]|uniref:Uncharacterized protein n=1 Tax=Chromobacterium amazonense TaxID=1382803 RepID=A0A2S9X5Z1_9NEIS|nr:hypothetical protein [Chromobacterium amazonense]MDQ4538944.1 hypothetical protein [Chromobacterium amazonense]PRP71095.1 hypothetical protein BUE93_09070 [Chromobacterium amazonense]